MNDDTIYLINKIHSHCHEEDLTFYIRPRSSDIPIVREVIRSKCYFGDGFLTIKQHDIVIDVGAHIGTFSILAASMGAAVISYEPVTMNYLLLKNNVDLNELPVTIYHAAIKEKNGKETIFIHAFNFGGSSFFHPNKDPDYQEEIVCITLADAMQENHIDKIDFLKLDCEDSELEILKFAKERSILPKIRQIAIEWIDLKRRQELLDLLDGYEIKEKGNDQMGIILAKRK